MLAPDYRISSASWSITRSGVSVWIVLIEPGCPVFTALRKVIACLPLISPGMMQLGRMRSEAISRSSTETSAYGTGKNAGTSGVSMGQGMGSAGCRQREDVVEKVASWVRWRG